MRSVRAQTFKPKPEIPFPSDLLECKRCGPKFDSLSPKPETLQPKPLTRNPNPKPQTSNPKPQPLQGRVPYAPPTEQEIQTATQGRSRSACATPDTRNRVPRRVSCARRARTRARWGQVATPLVRLYSKRVWIQKLSGNEVCCTA